jgi:hypothetical protein
VFPLFRPERDQTIRTEIGLQKLSRLAGDARYRFGGEVAAAHCTFHRCGPAGRGPIPREKQFVHAGFLLWTPPIDAGLRGKRGCCFFDDRGLHKVRIARGGEGLADFFEAKVDDFLARLLEEVVRGADDELEVLLGRCVGGFGV